MGDSHPRGENAIDSQLTYSGYTHGSNLPEEHLETDVRTRMGIGDADPEWHPGKAEETARKRGPKLKFTPRKKLAVARAAMALKKQGVEPTAAAAFGTSRSISIF